MSETSEMYYLCFSVNRLPDLTLTKYSVFDGSSVENIMDKHGVFLRQLHRLGYTSGVYFHLLYYYNPGRHIPKGRHLSILFYATAQDRTKLEGIREFLTTSVLSNYYDFYCYEIATSFSIEEEPLADGTKEPILKLTNISNQVKKYSIRKLDPEDITIVKDKIAAGERSHIVCEIASDADAILSLNKMPIDERGRVAPEKRFSCGAFITKKDYALPAQNRLNTDEAGEVVLYSIMEWEPCETGRLYNVLKLMEGYDRSAVLRIDIFPVEHTQAIRQRLPYAETRRRISDRMQGKDDNSESIVKSWDKYLTNLMKFPQFLANIVAFADSQDIAVMLADSVAAEAVESGTYLVETITSNDGFDMYEGDAKILHKDKEPGNYVAPFLSLYTLEEIRPMFSFPILYPGESIECQKETDPIPFAKELSIDKDTGEFHEVISLGVSSMGYDVTFPVKLFKKHAFIAGVPGAGKTNTMLYLVTTLWRNTQQHIPFLVLEPAKQEYRALAMIDGMEDLCVFSPGADTRFPLHINPFQFPVGLTLAEHIANLNAVFAGAFELIPPSPFLIDSCIEKVYLDKGWNINERNDGSKAYPTMQELYDSLKVAVEESGYEGESKANIRSVMEVRIGSLLRREIGNVYNVRTSSIEPEDWLNRPIIIELEALGEGPANFMSLLISTLIREVLKIRKTSDIVRPTNEMLKREVEHIIFYEEAHNLIGPTTDDPVGGSVDPKISATKYLVKMLAEVRALGEGIVIADQLPTAMAPEVLKNTGLKLGHRITAQDDRNLLGSTMSASADQLEEQGTFETGQALIFYENLLKPFKMRVAEWEKGTSKKKYDSPTNSQLYEHLKGNQTYQHLLARSAFIMQEKMQAEFDLLRQQAVSLKAKINEKYGRVKSASDNLALLQKKLKRMSSDAERSTTKKQIADTKLVYERLEKEFHGAIDRELKKLCWSFNNQYYAYMTLSKNYAALSPDMYMCTISNFLSLFGVMRSLHEVPYLSSTFLRETQGPIQDLAKYVDILGLGTEPILADHPAYSKAIYESGNYIINLIDADAELLLKKAQKLASQPLETDAPIIVFCKEFTELFMKYNNVAQRFYDTTNALASDVQSYMDDNLEPESDEWTASNNELTIYNARKTAVFKALAALAVSVFKCLKKLDRIYFPTLLKHTDGVQKKLIKIVNYNSQSARALLSDWKDYAVLREGASVVSTIEMRAKFDYVHRMREEVFGKAPHKKEDIGDYEKKVLEVIHLYNAVFFVYAKRNVGVFEYEIRLVQHFTVALEYILDLGPWVYPLLRNELNGNWRICAALIKKLSQREDTPESSIKTWNKLSGLMKKVCDE